MAWELDVVALSAAGFTALGVGLKSAWDRFLNRRERKDERDAARDEVHRNELRHAYGELITAFHKVIDHGFALAKVFLEHAEVMKRTEAARAAAVIQQVAFGGSPAGPTAMAEYQSVDARAKKISQEFDDAMTDVLGKGTAVQLIDDDTARGRSVLNLAKETVPPLETIEDATRFRDHLRDWRRRFDELIEDLGGAFAPRRWDVRGVAARQAAPQLTVKKPAEITSGK